MSFFSGQDVCLILLSSSTKEPACIMEIRRRPAAGSYILISRDDCIKRQGGTGGVKKTHITNERSGECKLANSHDLFAACCMGVVSARRFLPVIYIFRSLFVCTTCMRCGHSPETRNLDTSKSSKISNYVLVSVGSLFQAISTAR